METTITRFQKAAKADGAKIEITGKIDKATMDAMMNPGKNVAKWLKSEIGDIAEYQRTRHMLITGEADHWTVSRYLLSR